MELKKDVLYICFHKPISVIGFLISMRTFGKYAHCEFVLNDMVYLSNPGGVRAKPFIPKKYMDLYEVKLPFDKELFLKEFKKLKGRGYDYAGVLLGQLFNIDIDSSNRYFCSELCLYLLNKLTEDSLTYNFKSIKASEFSPAKLYKYLKEMEIISKGEVIKYE